MDNCVFCKIVKGEIPSDKTYEDKDFLAFLTIEPARDGHLLLIPKKHTVWMQDTDDETISEIFKLTKKLMHSLKAAMGSDYVMVSVAGKDVPHFHIHLIPRHFDDKLVEFSTKKYKEGEASEVAKKIKNALN
jgi:histidine triad (HIT) family protein